MLRRRAPANSRGFSFPEKGDLGALPPREKRGSRCCAEVLVAGGDLQDDDVAGECGLDGEGGCAVTLVVGSGEAKGVDGVVVADDRGELGAGYGFSALVGHVDVDGLLGALGDDGVLDLSFSVDRQDGRFCARHVLGWDGALISGDRAHCPWWGWLGVDLVDEALDVDLAQVAQLDALAAGEFRMPLHLATLEVLDDPAILDDEFSDRVTEDV